MLQRSAQLRSLSTIALVEEEDKNPPSGKIESSHKLPVRKKRKTPLQEEENNLLENDIQSFSLEDMELEADIEKIQFPEIEQQEHVVQQNTALEVVGN